MDGDRWRQVDKIFHDLIEQTPEQRAAFLDRLCVDGGGKDGGVHIVDKEDNSKDQLFHEGFDTVKSWSPDGKYLLLLSQDRQLYLLPLTGDQKPSSLESA
jgi:hypothetical protein